VFNLKLQFTSNLSENALLLITNDEDQTFTYYINSSQNQINITLINLKLETTYKICVYNASIRGNIVKSGQATTTNNPYTLLCSELNATITLSGLTISN